MRIVVASLVLAASACWGDNTITYRGETFHMSRRYSSYDAYKNDPHNVVTHELARIRYLMTTASIARHFKSVEAFSAATADLQFPGYGWSFADRQVVGGPMVHIEQYEIPPGEEERVLIWLDRKSEVDVLDDFVVKGTDAIVDRIEWRHGNAYYFSPSGRLLARRAVPL